MTLALAPNPAPTPTLSLTLTLTLSPTLTLTLSPTLTLRPSPSLSPSLTLIRRVAYLVIDPAHLAFLTASLLKPPVVRERVHFYDGSWLANPNPNPNPLTLTLTLTPTLTPAAWSTRGPLILAALASSSALVSDATVR